LKQNFKSEDGMYHIRNIPMTWATRLQISLDVARGLEYIYDHSVPVYINRDIKSENILLNENLTGKV
jgi:serine/threonine protein kinase